MTNPIHLPKCPQSQSTNGAHNKVYSDHGCKQCWHCTWCGMRGCEANADFRSPPILMHPDTWQQPSTDITLQSSEDKLRQLIKEEVKAALEELELKKEIRQLMQEFDWRNR